MLDVATIPDFLRLLVIPFFGFLAWRDIATRRVPDRLWIPLALLAIVLFAWETISVLTGDAASFQRQRYYIQAGISIGFIIPLTYLFWLIGGFGGADAKAFFILAVLFPTYPEYTLGTVGVSGTFAQLPLVQTTVGVFSLTILSNTVLAGVFYPVALAAKNAVTGYISPGMFVAKPISSTEAIREYGSLMDFPDRGLTDDLSLSGLSSYFGWRQLDLDALRMYLDWRDITLSELRANPDQYRNPESLPEDTHQPGDGSVETDGGSIAEGEDDPSLDGEQGRSGDKTRQYGDPWGAEAFLDDIEGSAYGTTAEGLRGGLDSLTSEDVVWISPGIPFLVPLFFGLLISFTYGDMLFAVLGMIGVA